MKTIAKSKDVIILDSDSDDGQTDSDKEVLLDDWNKWMVN